MKYFLDTSALLKKYLEEEGSQHIRDLIGEAEAVILSLITEVELTSALERAKRGNRLTSPDYRQATRDWEKDLNKTKFIKISIDQKVIHYARRFVKQHRLHPADSIQLASAVMVSKKFGDNVSFVCSDQPLLDAAHLERLPCVNVRR